MAKRRKRSGCRCSKGSIAGFSMSNLPVQRLMAVAGGAVGAKALNVPITKYLDKNPDGAVTKFVRGNKFGKVVVPGVKFGAGVYMMSQDNQMVQDAGLGVIAVAGMEITDALIPSLDLNTGVAGIAGDSFYIGGVGNTIRIDLDEISGAQFLEEEHDVAGALDIDQVSEEEMYDEYEMEGVL